MLNSIDPAGFIVGFMSKAKSAVKVVRQYQPLEYQYICNLIRVSKMQTRQAVLAIIVARFIVARFIVARSPGSA